MKIKLTFIIILLLTISSVFAGAFIQIITASASGDNIEIRWTSGTESNLSNYVIQRSPVNFDSFMDLKVIPPKGSNSSYSFIDESAYKTTSMIFVYRLKIVDNDQQVSYSAKISVTSGVSGIKSTWGSIKAMFR